MLNDILRNKNASDFLNNPVKKKRGRPRKNQNIDHNDTINIKKNQNSNKNKIQDNEEDSIILHLAISMDDVVNNVSSNSKTSETESNNNKLNNSSQDIFTINELSTFSPDKNDFNNSNLQKIVDEKDNIIFNLNKQIEELKKILSYSEEYEVIGNRIDKMNIDFINIQTGKTIVVDKTDLCCWNCTEQFNNMPCFLPEKIVGNTYHVFGCFCDDNCAATYNMALNDYKVMLRYSLLKKLHNEKYNNNDDVKLAPQKECLKKFGGTLTIQQLRNSSKNNNAKEFRIIMPPMKSIIPYIEQCSPNHNNHNNNNNNGNNNDLVLKRTKPLPNAHANLIHTVQRLKNKLN